MHWEVTITLGSPDAQNAWALNSCMGEYPAAVLARLQTWCTLADRIIRADFPHYDLVHGCSALHARTDVHSFGKLEPLAINFGLDLETMSAELHCFVGPCCANSNVALTSTLRLFGKT